MTRRLDRVREDGAPAGAGAALTAGSAAGPAVRSTCPYCGVGCGVLATPAADGTVAVAGDPDHPANLGRLCVKGAALGETLGLDGRLLQPLRRDTGGALQPLGWDAALDEVAQRFAQTIAEHGQDSVALYVSGQLLTEDYYVANKLMKGYIGSANIDTNSRLCMSSAVAAHKRAFGEDWVPVSYQDLEQSDLVVLVGSNTAWCHPVIWQRIVAERQRRPALRIVVIDPRRTPTADEADLHLPLAPGSDVALFNGLLAWLTQQGLTLPEAAGPAQDAALADAPTLDASATACGLDAQHLEAFFRLWAGTERVVTAFSQGVNQSSAGTDKGNAIINCHLATGRIGRPGMGPFSITGQPNAMGGREVGGLSNQLAAHLDLDKPEHRALVQGFWNSPTIAARPGHKAVELFEAVHDGRVKALWIIATNPVVSMPDADRVREALARCPFVVVSEVNRDTDSSHHAHLLLPAAAWGEKDGTVTNSERRISRQRAFLPLPGEARPDWWALAQVGQRMGYSGFEFQSAHEVFVEHCALTAAGNHAGAIPRLLDLGALASLDAQGYAQLPPLRWPLPAQLNPAASPADNPAANPIQPAACLVAVRARAPVNPLTAEYPLVLNTGRVRDQWHTMSRTGRSPRLATHVPEPFVEVNPADAAERALSEGTLARVATRWGSVLLRAVLTERVSRGQLFVPIHWNGETAADARVGALVNPVVDPLSGEPEFKHTPAGVEPAAMAWQGYALSRAPLALAGGSAPDYWARLQRSGHVRYELAGRAEPADRSAWARRLLGAPASADWIEAEDPATGRYRAAWFVDRRLAATVQLARDPAQLPARDAVGEIFALEVVDGRSRLSVLAGRTPGATADPGPTVCSCFAVGRNAILAAIHKHGDSTPEALGKRLRCGTNCGSCVPELRMLIASRGV